MAEQTNIVLDGVNTEMQPIIREDDEFPCGMTVYKRNPERDFTQEQKEFTSQFTDVSVEFKNDRIVVLARTGGKAEEVAHQIAYRFCEDLKALR